MAMLVALASSSASARAARPPAPASPAPAASAQAPLGAFTFHGPHRAPSADTQAKAQRVARALMARPTAQARILAHTGGLLETWEPAIAAQVRALEVFVALLQAGVPAHRVRIVSTPPHPAPAHVDVRVVVQDDAQSPQGGCRPGPGTHASELAATFTPGSATPSDLRCADLLALAEACEKDGGARILVAASTDATGRPRYNAQLAQLRQLRTLEALARAGVPISRIVLGTATPSAQGRSVRVVLQPGEAAAVASASSQQDGAPGAVPLVPEPAPAPVPVLVPVPEARPTPRGAAQTHVDPTPLQGPGHLDAVASLGAVVPLSALRHHARPAFAYGLGIGRALAVGRPGEVRLTLMLNATTSLRAREPGLDAFLQLLLLDLRVDGVLGQARVRPFVGVGPTFLAWRQRVRRGADGATVRVRSRDAGVLAVVGLQARLTSVLELAPEVGYRWLGGHFNASVLDARLALRARF